MNKVFFVSWIFISALFFLYSFTQVDLSLTLNRAGFLQPIQKSFQYIGYFNRPLSTVLYVSLIAASFLLYGVSLYWAKQKKISKLMIFKTIIPIAFILMFSYNAFSYDLFNYIFDAKIITQYHENPYIRKALDYPADPMLSFMRWTHRVYPYGPVWLALTVPLSFIGMGLFLPTFFLFKFLMTLSYIGSSFLIYKISEKTKLVNPSLALVFFALNPFVLIESIISAHNDIVMMFLMLASIYCMLFKRYISSGVLFILSIGIKFTTAFLLPAYLLFIFRKNTKEFLYASIILSIAAVIAVTIRLQFQPWYLLFVFTLAALVSSKYFVFIPSIILSIAASLIYIPFLYTGNWNPPIPQYISWVMIFGIFASVIIVSVYKFYKN